MAINEAALKRAQESAKEELGTPLDKEPGQEVTFWLVRHDDFERAVAEGIQAYLSDEEVKKIARTDYGRARWSDIDKVLRAIGGR